MSKFLPLLIMSLAILKCNGANAQYVFNTLDEVWEFAEENNPDIGIHLLQVEKSRAEQKVAASSIYPKVNVGFSGQHNINIAETPIPGEAVGIPGETQYIRFGLPYTYNGGITVSKNLFDWQSIYQAKIAKSNSRLREVEKAIYEQDLKEQLAQLYFATLTSIEAISNSNKDLGLSDSLLQITSDRYQQGLTDALALNQAKINWNTAWEMLELNKQYFIENELNLKSLLGLSASDTLHLNEKIGLIEYEDIQSVKPNTATINLYKTQIELAEFEKKQSYQSFIPKLEFVYYWGGTQYQENDFQLSFNSSDWRANSYIALNLSIPIFKGFGNKNQYKATRISRKVAQLNYEEELRKTALSDTLLLNNYRSALELARKAHENLTLSTETVQLAYSKYAEGMISLDSYLSVYDDHLSIESQYFSRLSDYMINKAIILSRSNY